MNNLILVGGGGHCLSCIDIIEETDKFKVKGYIDNINKKIKNYNYLGNDEDLLKYSNKRYLIFISIGQIKNSKNRELLFNNLSKRGYKFATIISDRSYLSKNSIVNNGSIIFRDVIINTNVIIGFNCIINNRALIEHGAKVGNHCHISTGAILNGDVSVGNNTFIGSGTIINEGIKIGNNCVVSSGLVIRKNVPSKSIVKKST